MKTTANDLVLGKVKMDRIPMGLLYKVVVYRALSTNKMLVDVLKGIHYMCVLFGVSMFSSFLMYYQFTC